jgi:hypothetical protein
MDYILFPSPPVGDRVRVRGNVISSPLGVLIYLKYFIDS